MPWIEHSAADDREIEEAADEQFEIDKQAADRIEWSDFDDPGPDDGDEQ